MLYTKSVMRKIYSILKWINHCSISYKHYKKTLFCLFTAVINLFIEIFLSVDSFEAQIVLPFYENGKPNNHKPCQASKIKVSMHAFWPFVQKSKKK